MKQKNITGLMVAVLFAITMSTFAYGSEVNDNTTTANTSGSRTSVIAEGIFVGDINVGGLTKEEANQAIEQFINSNADKNITLVLNDNKVTTTARELGYKWENANITKEVLKVAKTGNVIARFKEKTDILKDNKKYDLKTGMDNKVLSSKVEELCKPYNTPAKDATMKKVGGSYQITDEEEGLIVDTKATANSIKEKLSSWNGDNLEIEAASKVDKPKVTRAQCELVGTKPMGYFSTNYSPGSINRNKNIENGANLLNNVVLYPGETYSLLENLVPFTIDNGYYEAGTFEDGRVASGIGGGICQVSTTLYNALLDAEIEIVERSNHSMNVTYVPLAKDAAIAEGVKDLKFKNNTDAPIYIEAHANIMAGTIEFSIYGHDTRDSGRRVEYKSETLSTTPPSVKEIEDDTKLVGFRELKTAGYTGAVAKLWKYTYQDDKLLSKDLVNTSTYRMTETEYIVGTKKDKEEPTKKKKDKKSSSTDDTTKKKSDKATAKPSD